MILNEILLISSVLLVSAILLNKIGGKFGVTSLLNFMFRTKKRNSLKFFLNLCKQFLFLKLFL